MKALVLHPTFELYERNGKAFCSSLQVAETFEKEHRNVLRDIEKILQTKGIENFNRLNFELIKYEDVRGRKQPMYLMTRDGFMLLVMGYTGEKAMILKVAYIKRFDDMELSLDNYIRSREEFPPFTRAIQDAHDEPKSYHYSIECNMINRIVLGMDAKKFKETYGLGNVSSIRPYLNTQQVKSIKKLQSEDIPLLYKGVEYQERKIILTNFYNERLAIGG